MKRATGWRAVRQLGLPPGDGGSPEANAPDRCLRGPERRRRDDISDMQARRSVLQTPCRVTRNNTSNAQRMVCMSTALIIGSGAAAAGVALALSHRENLEITVIDIGLQLESDREQLIEDLASSSPDEWDRQLIELTSRQPAASRNSGIPEKRVFGSDYPFRNAGQLDGLTAVNGAAVL